MARVASKSNTPNNPTPPRKQRPIAERQESAKGDMFFKVVITLIIVGIIAVLLWFLIDALIPRPEAEPDRFVFDQFVLVEDIERIYNSVADPTAAQHFINPELGDAFNQLEGLTAIYIFVVNPLWEEWFVQDSLIYRRHAAMWDNYHALFDMGQVVEEGVQDRQEGFIYFENIAVFILNVNATANENWLLFADQIKDEELAPIGVGPIIIRIDISEPSPSFSLIYNDDVSEAIEGIMYFVEHGEYPSDENQDDETEE